MKLDSHLFYTMICAAAWFVSIFSAIVSIFRLDLWHFLGSIFMLFFFPVILEMLLNLWGFLTSSSLRRAKHTDEFERITQFKFPIIWSRHYCQSLFWMERKHGIENDLSYYIYRMLEEEEILDSKEEEEEWFEETADRIRRDQKRDEQRRKELEKRREEEKGRFDPEEERKGGDPVGTKALTETDRTDGNFTYSPQGVKNFYHEPDSPSRAFLMDYMSLWYLLKLCYSINLWKYLDIPCFFFPAWLIRWRVLIPQAIVAKGTVDGVDLALKHGWAINLGGGYTHAMKTEGDMFNIYPDIQLAIHFAKKWHIQQTRRILVINTSIMQANGVIKDFPKDEGVYVCDIFDNTAYPRDVDAQNMVHEKATVGQFDNDESYITKIRHKVNLALSSYAPDFVIYNAGYDCLPGDKYGRLQISESMVMLRDELIFREVIEDQGVPILMTIGGCYQRRAEYIIARSIRNIIVKLDLSEKPLQVTTASNVRYAQKLQSKYSRYDNEELGFTKNYGTRGTRRTSFSRDSDHVRVSGPGTAKPRPMRATYVDKPKPMATTDNKYDQIYKELEEGLYDRRSIGRVDVFSRGKG